jgi:hypothetical protein
MLITCPGCGAQTTDVHGTCRECGAPIVRPVTAAMRFRYCAQAFVIMAFVNFTSFWIISLLAGGSAFTGKIEGGRYFLREHHGFTEVGRGFYEFLYYHECSVFITFPLAFVFIALASLTEPGAMRRLLH